MVLTDQNKRLLAVAEKLTPRSQEALIAHAEAMVEGQEAMREDYGLTGEIAPFMGAKDGSPVLDAGITG